MLTRYSSCSTNYYFLLVLVFLAKLWIVLVFVSISRFVIVLDANWWIMLACTPDVQHVLTFVRKQRNVLVFVRGRSFKHEWPSSVNIPWKNALYLIAHHYQRSLIIQLRWNQSISTRQSSDNSFISDSTGIHTRDLDYTCVPNWRGYGVLVCKMRCWYRAGKIFIYHLITYNSK